MQPSKSYEETNVRLESLPSLGPTSMAVLLALYSLVFAFLVLLVQMGKVEQDVGIGLMVGFVLLQFLLGPWITDLSLRALGSLTWVKYEDLPPHMATFIAKVCEAKGIRRPRVGIINDGAPNAFTYGNTHRNARLVITQGILKLLDEREVRAVVAHELGHITHADFIFMTVAQMVPILMYTIYRVLTSSKKGDSRRGNALAAAAIVAYVFYILSQYIVLFLSRLREYWADRFSVEITRDPQSMAMALIKIAYGFAAQADVVESDDKKAAKKRKATLKDRLKRLKAVGAFGIADSTRPGAMGLYAAGSNGMPPASAMVWDLANPWSRFFELQSTHPMTAKRIKAIANQAAAMGIPINLEFPKVEGIGWGKFLFEVFILFLPWICTICLWIGSAFGARDPLSFRYLIAGFAIGSVLRLLFSYPSGPFKKSTVADLLKETKASPVHAIPVVVRGKVIGRGIPGYIFSEDFVMQDETGFVFLDYEAPIPFFNFFFALLRRGKYQGQNVVVEGWYRRSPMPYVEINRLRSETVGEAKCYRRAVALFVWTAVLFLSIGYPFLVPYLR